MAILHKNNSNKYISIPMEGLCSHDLWVRHDSSQAPERVTVRVWPKRLPEKKKSKFLLSRWSTAHGIYDLEIKDTRYMKQT